MDNKNELRYWFKVFKEKFGDSVPTMQMPKSLTDEDIIELIKKCIKEGKNLLPEMFGYGNYDGDKIY